ncbi:DUF7426 family protein [Prauserella endophytica]|uniref:DUF7426 family protein n=1 Tax=Prauserella endophytica TaxID=1592324 RepID=UPI000D8ACFAC|nr:hypothetical protein [Prauserella endophytica]PXY20310.1 hypothetical protein BAY59_31210 [Prauserella coralliicola]
MTTFPDLVDYQDDTTDKPLVLPINGKQYAFPAAIPMARGIQIVQLREEMRRAAKARVEAIETLTDQLGREPSVDEVVAHLAEHGPKPRKDLDLDDAGEVELYLDLIGPKRRAEMEANGVTYPQMVKVGATLLAWHIVGADYARRVWTNGGQIEGGDVRPPEQAGESSGPPKTSRSSSTKTKRASSRKTPARKSRGATTSNGGGSSKPTSTASTE